MSDADDTRSVGGTTSGVQMLSHAQVADYWAKVYEALVDVFGTRDQDAGRLVERVRERIDHELPPDSQSAIYNVDPFQVAADLSGAQGRSVTDDEMRNYAKIAWNPDARERASHPDLLGAEVTFHRFV